MLGCSLLPPPPLVSRTHPEDEPPPQVVRQRRQGPVVVEQAVVEHTEGILPIYEACKTGRQHGRLGQREGATGLLMAWAAGPGASGHQKLAARSRCSRRSRHPSNNSLMRAKVAARPGTMAPAWATSPTTAQSVDSRGPRYTSATHSGVSFKGPACKAAAKQRA